jgi:hypothetical protein
VILDLQKAVEDVYPTYNDLLLKGEHGFQTNLLLGTFDKA